MILLNLDDFHLFIYAQDAYTENEKYQFFEKIKTHLSLKLKVSILKQ